MAAAILVSLGVAKGCSLTQYFMQSAGNYIILAQLKKALSTVKILKKKQEKNSTGKTEFSLSLVFWIN